MVRTLSFVVMLLAAWSAEAAERSVTLAVENMTCATCPISEGWSSSVSAA